MSDALRESTGDKLSRNLKPEGAKSTTESLGDTARDAYESVAGSVQPNSEKSAFQKASDTLGGNDKSTSSVSGNSAPGQSATLTEQVMGAVGLNPQQAVLPQLQQKAADLVNSASETIQGAGAAASKEGNKEIAKDSNASLGTRASAAGDALSDKVSQESHNAKA